MSATCALMVLLLAAAPEDAVPLPRLEPGAPVLAWGAHTYCFRRGGESTGPEWRAQCDDKTRTCLLAPNFEVDSDGRPAGSLSRNGWCDPSRSEQGLLDEGWQFVDAVADSPPGWRRDARGRVMQVSFDLHRRVYLGGGWVPWAEGPGRFQGLLATGFEAQWLDDDENAAMMYRLKLFEGEAYSDASWLQATAIHFDTSRGGKKPGLRVTTFFGTPERHDVDLSFGFWLDVLSVEMRRTGPRDHANLGFGGIGGTLDLWHSKDLESYVRLRAATAFEQDRTTRVVNFLPTGAAEADIVLGDKGLHHLRALAQYQHVMPMKDGPKQGDRLRFKLAYEVGLIALNDQPLTAVVEGRADWRTDLPDTPETWDYVGQISLRFSLWVPARRGSKLQTSL